MCLRFMFLLTTRLAAWLRLPRREETWKTAEILILRRQLAVLQRQQPPRLKLNWADRALLATLFSVIPKARRRGCRCWSPGHDPALAPRHRPPPLGRQVHACQDRPADHPPEHQGPGLPASPAEPRMGLPQNPRGTGRSGNASLGVDGVGDLEEDRNRPRTAADYAVQSTSGVAVRARVMASAVLA
jgi:hypothetical protein